MNKLSQEYVANLFKEQGCELLDVYINKRTKVKYRCSCKNISYITLGDFNAGRRCGCGNKKRGITRRHSIEYVKKIFQEAGCELLDDYENNHKPMLYRCSCNNISKISLASFQNGRRCKQCGIKKHIKHDGKLRYAIKRKCGSALRVSLESTGQRKNTKTEQMLGYTRQELLNRITNHPNWNNVKDGKWDLDHIFPIKAFVDYGIHDLKIINALDNLQPLSHLDNMKKNSTYIPELFEQYLRSKNVPSFSPTN